MLNEDLKILHKIAQAIFDKKGSNIIAFDVRNFSTMTDYYMIAEGHVDRHVSALGKEVIDTLNEAGNQPIHVEGLIDGDWVVIDYGAIVIHLLTPDMRERYSLEELWRPGKIVSLKIDTKKPVREQNE